MTRVLLFFFLLGAAFGALIPPARLTPWTPGVYTGVIGGIPTTRTNIVNVTLTPYFADNTGATDAAPAIQSAINAAVANDIIYLPNGTYKLLSGLSVAVGRDDVTIRGQSQAGVILDSHASSFGIMVGTDGDRENPQAVTGGLTKDSSTITVASTAAFTVNKVAELVFEDDLTIPVVSVSGYAQNRSQKIYVQSKTPTTITFWPPIIPNPNTTTTAYTRPFTLKGIGVEHLTIDGTNGTFITGLGFVGTYNCWALDVKVIKAANYPFNCANNLNLQLESCYARERNPNGGTNGGAILSNFNTSCLFWDNITYQMFPLVEVNFSTMGSVFAYNFFYDSSQFGVGGAGVDTNHAPHNCFNLYEGNFAPNIQVDGYFGSTSDDTVFRNWLHGIQPVYAGASPAFVANRFTRNYSLVGNVFGNLVYPSASNGVIGWGNPNLGNGDHTGIAQLSVGDDWADNSQTGLVGTLTTLYSMAITGEASSDVLAFSAPPKLVDGYSQVKFTSITSGLGGLTVGTVYYAVNVGANRATSVTYKLASSFANAIAGPPVTIDITSDGGGDLSVGDATITFTSSVGQLTDALGHGPLSLQSSTVDVLWATGHRRHSNQVNLVSGLNVTFGNRDDGNTTQEPFPTAGTPVVAWAGPPGWQELDLDAQASALLTNNRYLYTSQTDNARLFAGSAASDELTFVIDHEQYTGNAIRIAVNAGLGGLTGGTTYYLIITGPSTAKVAASYANAIAGTAINITTDGSGSAAWGDGTALPNSLFITSAPAFFSGFAWPPVDPTVTTQSFSDLPAGSRFVEFDPPGVSSIVAQESGTEVRFNFNKVVTAGAGGWNGFTTSLSGVTLAYSSGSGTATISYTPSRTIIEEEVFTISYTQPGDGIKDVTAAANLLVTFSGRSCLNNSAQTGNAVWLGPVFGATNSDGPNSAATALAQLITVTDSGIATRLRCYTAAQLFNAPFKMALYSGTTLIANGSGTMSGTDRFQIVPISSTHLDAGVYRVSVNVAANMDPVFRYDSTATMGNSEYMNESYSSSPASTWVPDGSLARDYAFGIKIIPDAPPPGGSAANVAGTTTVTGTLTVP